MTRYRATREVPSNATRFDPAVRPDPVGRAAYRGNYARLVEAKRAWDPENLFRLNQNIRPDS